MNLTEQVAEFFKSGIPQSAAALVAGVYFLIMIAIKIRRGFKSRATARREEKERIAREQQEANERAAREEARLAALPKVPTPLGEEVVKLLRAEEDGNSWVLERSKETGIATLQRGRVRIQLVSAPNQVQVLLNKTFGSVRPGDDGVTDVTDRLEPWEKTIIFNLGSDHAVRLRRAEEERLTTELVNLVRISNNRQG